MLAIPFPIIDPVAITLGSFPIRWYSLAYLVSILLGWLYARTIAEQKPHYFKAKDIDDFVFWAVLGVVLGGRLGFILFYQYNIIDQYLLDPIQIFAVWKGGMSFHGGAIGVILAIYFFSLKRKISFFTFGDVIVCVVPIGLFFGRIANFINAELYGRVSTVPWAMVFPNAGPDPRHPSQLYEAFLEGLAIFCILWAFRVFVQMRHYPGMLGGSFLVLYGTFRAFVEIFRQPDHHIGFIYGQLTLGQLYSLPIILLGLYCVVRAVRKSVFIK